MRKINLHLGDFTEKSNVKLVPDIMVKLSAGLQKEMKK